MCAQTPRATLPARAERGAGGHGRSRRRSTTATTMRSRYRPAAGPRTGGATMRAPAGAAAVPGAVACAQWPGRVRGALGR